MSSPLQETSADQHLGWSLSQFFCIQTSHLSLTKHAQELFLQWNHENISNFRTSAVASAAEDGTDSVDLYGEEVRFHSPSHKSSHVSVNKTFEITCFCSVVLFL